jgi:hypothetical protein
LHTSDPSKTPWETFGKAANMRLTRYFMLRFAANPDANAADGIARGFKCGRTR